MKKNNKDSRKKRQAHAVRTSNRRESQRQARFNKVDSRSARLSDMTVRQNLHGNIQVSPFINSPTMTPEGFLQVDVVVAEEGVLPYDIETENGIKRRNELLGEAIYEKKFIDSCEGLPFVLQHPQKRNGEFVSVDTSNFRDFMSGVLFNIRADKQNNRVLGTLKIMDKDVIELVQSEELTEVSQGYTCVVTNEAGEFGGKKFDAVQSDLFMNHLALVNEGRAGKSVRVLLNAKQITIKTKNEVDRIMKAILARRNQDDTNDDDPPAKKPEPEVNAFDADDDERPKANNPNMEGLAKLGEVLASGVEIIKGMMGGDQQQLNQEAVLEGAAPKPVPPNDPFKSTVLSAANIRRQRDQETMDLLQQRENALVLGQTVLGVDASVILSRHNTVDGFLRHCLLETKTKTKGEVDKMNQYQVLAHLEASVDMISKKINSSQSNGESTGEYLGETADGVIQGSLDDFAN